MNKTKKFLIPMLIITLISILCAGTVLFVSKSKNKTNHINNAVAMAETKFEPYTNEEKNCINNMLSNVFAIDDYDDYQNNIVNCYIDAFENAQIDVNSVTSIINAIELIAEEEYKKPTLDTISINSIFRLLSDVASFNNVPKNLLKIFNTGATNEQLAEALSNALVNQAILVTSDTIPLYQYIYNNFNMANNTTVSFVVSSAIDMLPIVSEYVIENKEDIITKLTPTITNALNVIQAMLYYYQQTTVYDIFSIINDINNGVVIDNIDIVAEKALSLADKIESYSQDGVYIKIDNNIMKIIYSVTSKMSFALSMASDYININFDFIKDFLADLPKTINNTVTLINQTIHSSVELLRSFEKEINYVNNNGELQTITISKALTIVASEFVNDQVNYENLGIIISNIVAELPYNQIKKIANTLLLTTSNSNSFNIDFSTINNRLVEISRLMGIFEGISNFKNIALNFRNNEETAKNANNYLTFSFSYVNIDDGNTVENICFADYVNLLKNSIEDITNYNIINLAA